MICSQKIVHKNTIKWKLKCLRRNTLYYCLEKHIRPGLLGFSPKSSITGPFTAQTVLSCVVLLRCGQWFKRVVRTLWWKTAKRLVEKDVGHFHKISLANGMKQQPLQSEDNSKIHWRIHNPHSAKRLALISYTWPFMELSTKYLYTGTGLD